MSDIKRVGVMMELDKPHKWHAGTFAGIHDYAQMHPDWRLIVDDWADHTLAGHHGSAPRYDGIIGRITSLGATQARRLGVPAVNVWVSTPAKGLPSVFPDYAGSGRLIAEHLLNRGFVRMAALIDPEDRSVLRQEAALRERATSKGLARWCGTLAIPSDDTPADWQRSLDEIRRWMDGLELPVGMLVRDPRHARAVIEMARDRGWQIPQDVAIVCSLNDEPLCQRPEPGLTSVRIPYEACGFEAAKMLDNLIDVSRIGGDPFAEPETVIVPNVEMVCRFSTDFFAVADPVVRDALSHIATHLNQPLSVEQVAAQTSVSRRTLDARFHQALGATVASEINRLRLERVKRELTSSSDTIAEIAYRTGFASIRAFNEQFHKAVGMSPRAFRMHATRPHTAK